VKKAVIFGIISVLAIVILVYSISKLIYNKSEGRSYVEDLRVCTFVNSNQPCVKEIESIPQDTLDIYATVWVKNIEAEEISVTWYFKQNGVESVISEDEREVFNNGIVQFRLEKDYARGWLVGEYLVEVKLSSNSSVLSETFSISSED